MSETLQRVLGLIQQGEVKISSHGYDELAADTIYFRDVMSGVTEAEVVEDYPEYSKGPCGPVLQWDSEGQPMHVLWGIPQNMRLRLPYELPHIAGIPHTGRTILRGDKDDKKTTYQVNP